MSELKSQSSVPKRKTRSKAVCENPEEDSPDSEEDVYYSRPQFEVVSESYTVHTSGATELGKKDITQSLETGSVSETPECQVTEDLPVNLEENLPENPGVQPEREESVDLTHSTTSVNPSFNGEPSMPESSSPGKELNDAGNIETDTETFEDEAHTQNELRRSVRVKEKPRILTYPKLGNPLITIVQSLLQGLNDAFSESLQDYSQLSLQKSADTNNMQRDLHDSKGGGCNPGSKTFEV